jgi:hypothetical protein
MENKPTKLTIANFCKKFNIPTTRILILVDNGRKLPIYEQNNLSVEEIHERNKTNYMTVKTHKIPILEKPEYYYSNGNKIPIKSTDVLVPTHSLYLKHTTNIYCIDIDDPNIKSMTDFIECLKSSNVSDIFINFVSKCHYTYGNTKGIHIYIQIENMPSYSNQQDVYKNFKGDLIRVNNMWERSDKFIFETCPDIQTIDYTEICDVFDECKLNKSANTVKKSSEKISANTNIVIPEPKENYTLDDAKTETEKYIISGINNKIFCKMSGYTNWLFLAFIIKNECSTENAFNLFNHICRYQYEPDKYSEIGVKNKFDMINGEIKYTDKKPLTVKTLIKMYADLDANILKSIKKDIATYTKKTQPSKKTVELPTDVRHFDSNFFNSLEDYQTKKKYFEKFVCKVLRPNPIYVYTEYENDKLTRVLYCQNKLRECFLHLEGDTKIGKNDEVILLRFVNQWLDDSSIRQYNTMDFLPMNKVISLEDEYIEDTTQYNLFTGYNPVIKTEFEKSKRDTIIKPFTDLLYQLVGADDKNFNYMINLLSHIIQNPSKRLPVAIVIKSKEGVGKNVFLDTFANIIDKSHYLTSCKPSDFFGEHAEIGNKLIINMNECEGKDTLDLQGRIKSFVTEEKIRVNAKNLRPYDINNFAYLFIFTNKPNPIKIDVRAKDRRFIVFQSTMKYLEKQYNFAFWTSLTDYFKKPAFLSALYDYFNTNDVKNWNWKARPITEAYLEMARQFIPVESLFLEDQIFKNGKSLVSYSRTELYDSFITYCANTGVQTTFSNLQKLLTGFAEIDIPYKVIKRSDGQVYTFDLGEIHTILVKKGHIQEFDEDKKDDSNSEVAEDEKLDASFEGYFCI